MRDATRLQWGKTPNSWLTQERVVATAIEVETTPMSRLVSKHSDPDLDRRPFPLFAIALGLVGAMNVTSATAMLLSM